MARLRLYSRRVGRCRGRRSSWGADRWEVLVRVAQRTRRAVSAPDNDFAWSGWEGPEDAVRELDGILSGLDRHDLESARELNVLFLPTGPVCELAASSAWFRRYEVLADRCMQAVAQLSD